MEKTKQYKIEGAILDIPMHWDEHSQKYLEDYSLLIENPAYTPEGRPILLTIEDACRYSEPADDDPSSIDCGSCRYYRQISGTLLGVFFRCDIPPAVCRKSAATTVRFPAHCWGYVTTEKCAPAQSRRSLKPA